MRGTLVLLCILLFIWIGGSSYWYICKINDHCDGDEIVIVEPEIPDETTGHVETDKEQDILSGEETEKIIEAPLIIDSVAMAREFIEANSLKTIYFDYAQYDARVSEEDSRFLKMLSIYIENEPGKLVYITGHSDSIGTPEGLVFASYQRVLSMTSILMDIGIPKTRIESKSLGEGYPAASNSTAQGRAMNRRVEISLRNL